MTAIAHRVKITYCAECGYEPQTLELAKALMLEFGAFDVSIDGELLHSMSRDGGFPKDKAIADAVRARLPA